MNDYHRRKLKEKGDALESATKYSDLELPSASGSYIRMSQQSGARTSHKSGALTPHQSGALTPHQSDALTPNPWQLEYAKLCFGESIGTGSFGTVYSGTLKGVNSRVAIKKLRLSSDQDSKNAELQAANTEMAVLFGLTHPNILKFHGAAFVRERGEEMLCLVSVMKPFVQCTCFADFLIPGDRAMYR
jgi:hypothetical protein